MGGKKEKKEWEGRRGEGRQRKVKLQSNSKQAGERLCLEMRAHSPSAEPEDGDELSYVGPGKQPFSDHLHGDVGPELNSHCFPFP